MLAGGRSRRYGEDKAFASVGGVSLVRRAIAALEPVTDRVVLIANETELFASVRLPVRPDVRAGIGALGGVHTAVSWAREDGAVGTFVLACDMPFVPSALVAGLLERVERDRIVVPASPGPRGFEPLCAAYGVGCLRPIEEAIDRGERAVISFFGHVTVDVMTPAEVAAFGDPDRIFFNVNRPRDRSDAEALLTGHESRDRTDQEDPTP